MFRAVIFDIEGVLQFQGEVYPGAIELVALLRQKGVAVRFLTNSTLHSRRSYAEKLRSKGFSVYDEEVVTASFATAQFLKSLQPRSCWVMLKGKGLEEFRGLPQDTNDPEYIALGDLREDFNSQNLNKALRLLYKGAKLIVMIPEKVDNSLGELELTVGAYGRMLEDAAGIKATYIGKPSRYIFDLVLDTLKDIERREILMVGDKVETDILGAREAGLGSALVKTGDFRERDLRSAIAPDYIFDSVREVGRLFPQKLF